MHVRPLDSSLHLGHAQSELAALTTSLLMGAERRVERHRGESEVKDGHPLEVMPEMGFEAGGGLQVDQESGGSPDRT